MIETLKQSHHFQKTLKPYPFATDEIVGKVNEERCVWHYIKSGPSSVSFDQNWMKRDLRALFLGLQLISSLLTHLPPSWLSAVSPACQQTFGIKQLHVNNDLEGLLFAFLNHSTKFLLFLSVFVLQWPELQEANCMCLTWLFLPLSLWFCSTLVLLT